MQSQRYASNLMKLDRLIGILAILQQKEKITAGMLAEKFEVSRRTIVRDIETLCRAGLPIVTTQGQDGGIALMDGYVLNSAVLKKDELSAILTGLQSLNSISLDESTNILYKKLQSEQTSDEIRIDLASFYKDDFADKITQLRYAIRTRHRVAFHYYYGKGDEDKIIEPYQILYQWADWYVYGYSPQRHAFRTYKLRRLWHLQLLEETFVLRKMPEETIRHGTNMTDDYKITAIYAPSAAYRLVEEYGPDSFRVMEDGNLYTEWGFSDPAYALSWFLSFGNAVTVIAPDAFIEQLREEIEKLSAKYQKI